jgi:hypothetical protein
MPLYYTYREPFPLTPQSPYIATWDNPADWPKTYDYVPSQGIHPPGPVYQNNNPGQPGLWPYGYGQPCAPGITPPYFQGYGTVSYQISLERQPC